MTSLKNSMGAVWKDWYISCASGFTIISKPYPILDTKSCHKGVKFIKIKQQI